MRPVLSNLNLRAVQQVADAISRQVTALLRRGETDAWKPPYFGLKSKADIRNPDAGCLAFDTTTDPWEIVRFNGTTWVQTYTAGAGGASTAAEVTTDTSAFAGILSAADTTVQAALDTLDDYSGGTGSASLDEIIAVRVLF